MTLRIRIMAFAAGALCAAASFAQAPAAAPAGSTGMCRDGSYWSGATKRGACSGHKGVQDWYGAAGSAAAGGAAAPASSAAAAASPAATAAPAASAAPAPAAPAAAAAVATRANAPAAAAAPGGGPGMVWVNTSSKVYHCQTDRWYGKTKNGKYLSESDAVAQGDRPDHGKACAK